MNIISCIIPFLAGFLVFLRTTTGAFFPDDTPWTMSAVFSLEHQHPPGYPLYTLLSRLWAVIPLGGASFRLNLLSAVLMSLAGVMVGLLAFEIIRRGVKTGPRARLLFILAPALVFDLSWTSWEQALSFKGGVYALNTLITLGIIGLSSGLIASNLAASRLLAGLALLIGAGLAHHWMTILINLPLAVLPLAWWRRNTLPGAQKGIYALVYVLLGLSTYLLLPIRSGKAYVNWGVPGDLKGFVSVVTRAQYRSEERTSPPPGYWNQKISYVSRFFRREWTTPGLFLVLVGLIASLTLLPRESLALFLSAVFTAFSVFWYDLKPPDCFFSRAHFYLPTIAILSVFIGVSLGSIWMIVAGRSRIIFSLIWLTVMGFTAYGRIESHDLSHAYVPYDYAKNILDSAPHNAVLLCEGEGDWFSCLFQTQVNGYRNDIDPVNYYLMRIGYRPFLKAYSLKYPGLVIRSASGYSMNPRPGRPIVASTEMLDPSFPPTARIGMVHYGHGYPEERAGRVFPRLRSRGVFDVAKLTEMYSTYAGTAVSPWLPPRF